MVKIEGEYDPNRMPSALVAYETEGEAIIVANSQREGKLSHHVAYFRRAQAISEAGLSWFVIELNGITCTVFSGDTDRAALQRLHEKQNLLVVYAENVRADIYFGRVEYPLAGLLTATNELVYKSPGFDWNKYQPLIERSNDPRIINFYSKGHNLQR